MSNINLTVFIGRFQIFTEAHRHIMTTALSLSDNLLILIGSAGIPRNIRNPFTFEERRALILSCFSAKDQKRIIISPMYDYTYDNNKWVIAVQQAVKDTGITGNISLIGHSKDRSSFYLKMFPQWSSINVDNYHNISATPIRNEFFETKNKITIHDVIHHEFTNHNKWQDVYDLPEKTIQFLNNFKDSESYYNLCKEYEFIKNYQKGFEHEKYKPMFITVDACIIQSGHVLLTQRKSMPGKELWSFPGGFIEADETIETAIFRKIYEKTHIKIPEAVLRGSLETIKVFDDPFRSTRGRTITHVGLIKLKDAIELPKIKSSESKWWPIADVKRDIMFEDHYCILDHYISMV